MAVVPGEGRDQSGQAFRQRMGIVGCVGNQNCFHAGNRGGRLRRGGALVPGDQYVDVTADLLRRGHRVEKRRPDGGVVVFGKNQDSHQIAFASFRSFSTSSWTLLTILPAMRFGGSCTFSVFRRGATSTPSASGVSVSRGFFFAFMMFGSVT